jgi:hypothetical protein
MERVEFATLCKLILILASCSVYFITIGVLSINASNQFNNKQMNCNEEELKSF